MIQRLLVALAILQLACSVDARASSFPIPASLDHEVLSEDSPTAWKPTRIGIAQYEAIWRDPPIEGVSLGLGTRSFDWVRSMDVLVLPRGQLIVRANDIDGGVVTASGASQQFVRESDGTWHAAIPVALFGEPEYGIEVQVSRGGRIHRAKAGLRFKAEGVAREELFATDTTCSTFGLKAIDNRLGSGKTWIMAGCRYVYSEGESYRVSDLEVYLRWEGAGEEIRFNGMPLRPIRPGLWLLRLRQQPGTVEIEAVNGDRVVFNYHIPERAYYLRLSGGAGPYAFDFTGNGESVSTAALMAAVYGSYYFSDDIQVTTFVSAMTERHLLSSLGVYLRSRSFRFLDRRFALSLNVGGQFVGFASQGHYYFLLRFPQGSELTWTDAFGKGHDLTLGGFYYPPINGTSYAELWMRVRFARMFGEVNYIEWNQTAQTASGALLTPFYARSIGLNIGIPIGGAL